MFRLVGLLALGAMLGCSSEPAEVIVACASPSGHAVASLVRISNQEVGLNIRPAGMQLDPTMRSFSIRYGYDAILRWQDEHHLVVEYPKDAVVQMQEPVVFGTSQTFDDRHPIHLEYRPRASVHGHFITQQRCFRGD